MSGSRRILAPGRRLARGLLTPLAPRGCRVRGVNFREPEQDTHTDKDLNMGVQVTHFTSGVPIEEPVTFASIHMSEGTDVVALSRALGHHSQALTLSRYAHLLPGELALPLDIDTVLSRSGGARNGHEALRTPADLSRARFHRIRMKPSPT